MSMLKLVNILTFSVLLVFTEQNVNFLFVGPTAVKMVELVLMIKIQRFLALAKMDLLGVIVKSGLAMQIYADQD